MKYTAARGDSPGKFRTPRGKEEGRRGRLMREGVCARHPAMATGDFW